ncbi:hypothetical protein TRFO_28663 [Tritrichomonas foetus]|uniref:receptor protein-tyrosine kinase n=1 Tax=Tritrichomonas foetus TaxID=1144522 RepID=A0A1J4K374_9EUKA|nr:hypothetical protein TRFO_28663 [Tritrichomonas foetus]|eukprot:OHT03949.1 hypothetical protein TRFO_28663 [Tritrichomonas foetus]
MIFAVFLNLISADLKIFNFSGTHQKTILKPGRYKIECFGAKGGNKVFESDFYHGGRGAKVALHISFNTETTLHLFVGGRGGDAEYGKAGGGGFNGGGRGGICKDLTGKPYTGAGGGGASDLRLVVDGDDYWSEESLESRIVVAAGGSGAAVVHDGAPGGDGNGYCFTPSLSKSNRTNQTHGYRKGWGGDGESNKIYPISGSGGGGWYYGGFGGKSFDTFDDDPTSGRVGESGSSFVTGGEVYRVSRVAVEAGGNRGDDGSVTIETVFVCHSGCLGCSGPSAAECLACPAGFFLDAGRCLPVPSAAFSPSHEFTQTNPFSASGEFTQSSFFTSSNCFSSSQFFSPSSVFSSSEEFTASQHFSPSNSFTDSKQFFSSHSFTQSKSFLPTPLFTSSKTFTPYIFVNSFNSSNDDGLIFDQDREKKMADSLIITITCGSFAVLVIIISLIVFLVRHMKSNEVSMDSGSESNGESRDRFAEKQEFVWKYGGMDFSSETDQWLKNY